MKAANSKKIWSKHEDEQLIELVESSDRKTFKEIAEILGRSLSSVMNRVCIFREKGLIKETSRRAVWTFDMDEFVEDHYMNMSYKEIGKCLGLKESQVQSRVVSLGLPRKKVRQDVDKAY